LSAAGFKGAGGFLGGVYDREGVVCTPTEGKRGNRGQKLERGPGSDASFIAQAKRKERGLKIYFMS